VRVDVAEIVVQRPPFEQRTTSGATIGKGDPKGTVPVYFAKHEFVGPEPSTVNETETLELRVIQGVFT
jgi:hypothetical protein